MWRQTPRSRNRYLAQYNFPASPQVLSHACAGAGDKEHVFLPLFYSRTSKGKDFTLIL